jgi:hypothetical protein
MATEVVVRHEKTILKIGAERHKGHIGWPKDTKDILVADERPIRLQD